MKYLTAALILFISSSAYAQYPSLIQGLGSSGINQNGPCLDKDGDGYGVGAGCLGPDADDNDPGVHSAADVQAKYGPDPGSNNVSRPINNWLAHLGYQTETISGSTLSSGHRVWCVDGVNGSDTTTGGVSTVSADDACAAPWKTYGASAYGNLAAGDIVIFRAGTYAGPIYIPNVGTASNPVAYIAYPGEQPIVDAGGFTGFDGTTNGASNYVIDGFLVDDAASGAAIAMGAQSGNTYVLVSNIAIRHNDVCCSGGGASGNIAGDNLHNVIVEENVSHDAPGGSHNIYLGSNTQASDGVIIRRNIVYNQLNATQLPQVQFNGRCNWDNTGTPCQISQNLIYSGNGGGITVLEGYAYSFITSNVIFNSGKGITIYNYNGDCNQTNSMGGGGSGPGGTTGTICPYDENYNVIANNTIWVNPYDPTGNQYWSPSEGDSGFDLGISVNNGTSAEVDNITGMSWAGGTVTATISSSIGYGETAIQAGQAITVAGVSPSAWNGTFTVASVTTNPNSVSFTLTYSAANPGSSYASGGTVTDNAATCTSGNLPCGDLGHNTYANNIVIGAGDNDTNPPVFYYNPGLYLPTDTWTNNLFYQAVPNAEGGNVIGYNGSSYSCAAWPAGTSSGCLNANPLFVNAAAANYAAPQNFVLSLASGSPALNAGTPNGVPAADIIGKVFWAAPSLGAYEQTGYQGGWTDLLGTQIQPNCPLPGQAGSVDGSGDPYNYPYYCLGLVRAWSGAVADTTNNFMYIWGGGHSDYGGNELYRLNLNTTPPELTRLNAPSQITEAQFNAAASPVADADGNPNSRHTYGNITYIPPDASHTMGQMFVFGGGLYGGGSHDDDAWLLDFATLQWTQMNPVTVTNPPPGDPYGGAGNKTSDTPFWGVVAYDSYTDTVWIAGIDNDLFQYNYHNNSYTWQGGQGNALIPYDSYGAIDETHHKFWFFGNNNPGDGGEVYCIDLTGGTGCGNTQPYQSVNMTSQTTGCAGSAGSIANTPWPGMAWDPNIGKFVLWPLNGGNTYWTFDPVAMTCSSQTLAGSGPTSGSADGVFGRFAYFPNLNAFVALNDYNVDAQVLNLSGSSPVLVPTISVVSGNGQTGTAGEALANPFTVRVTGSNGSPVSGVPVTFAVTAGGGSLSPSSPISTDSQGLASATLTLGSTAGATNTVTASASGYSGSPVSFTASSTSGSGGGGSSSPTEAVSPSSLAFSGSVGGTNPTSQTISVSNSGGGTLSWTATASTTSGGSWLSASPASGGNSGAITVSVSLSGLAAGTYSGNIQIAASGATNTPQNVPVTLSVGSSTSPTEAVSPSSLTFSGSVGGSNPSSQTIGVSNSGVGTLSWTATASTTSGGSWLSASPASGGNSGTITVSVSLSGLAAGTYSGNVQIAASGASNTPQNVPVTLSVGSSQNSPAIALSPGSLSFSASPGGSNPASQTVSISNSGTGTLSWTATASTSSGGNWLSVSPASGTGSGSIAASVSIAGLSAGTYSGSIQLAATGAGNSPQSLAVTLTIGSSSSSPLSVSPGALTFNVLKGESDPSPQTLNISGSVSGAFSWTASAGASWIDLSETSGFGNGVITVSLSTAGFNAGTYTSEISITSSGAINASQSVPITLIVAGCTYTLSSTGQSFGVNGGSTTVAVTAPSGCAWTAASNSSFITVTSGSSGSGSGTVDLSVAANGGTDLVSGTVSIAGLLYTVVEAGSTPLPALSVNPPSISVSMAAGSASATRAIEISSSSGAQSWALVSQAYGGQSGWLAVSATSGTAAAGQPSVVNLTFDPSGMSPGIYQAQITVQNSSGATAGVVPVALQITSSSTAQLLLNQTSFVFFTQQGGATPPTQVLQISNGGQGNMNWSISQPTSATFTVSGFNGVAAEAEGSSVVLGVNPTGLSPGVYQDLLQVTAPEASNGSQYVLVTLQVVSSNAAAQGQMFPGGMLFTAVQGGAASPGQTLIINNAGGSSLSLSLQATTSSGGNWLSVSPASGTAGPEPAMTEVSADVGNLTAGIYRGDIVATFGSATQQAEVVLVVEPPSGCVPSGMDMLVSSMNSGASPSVSFPQALVAQLVDNCGNPVNTASVSVSVDGLNIVLPWVGNGAYSATWTPQNPEQSSAVVLTAVDPGLGTLERSYTVTEAAPVGETLPAVLPAGVVGGASFASQAPLAPGSIIAIFGSNLAGTPSSATQLPLPQSLGEVSVTINGENAPLYYASSGQINAQVPFDLTPGQTATVVVSANGMQVAPQNYLIAPAEPAIFTLTTTSGTVGIIVNTQNQLITASNPAQPGDVLIIYADGLGLTSPAVATGQPSPAAQAVLPVTVTVGGVQVPVQYAGLTPTLTGLDQINIQLAGSIPTGNNVPVVVTQNGVSSNIASISIQ